MAEQNGISVKPDPIPADVDSVMADAMRLKQVLLNLLSNTIKNNKKAGTVRIHCRVAGADKVRIFVADTGDGLSCEQLAVLFQPFERLDANKRPIQGTGIGLALSKHLIELRGGSIWVESERQGQHFLGGVGEGAVHTYLGALQAATL